MTLPDPSDWRKDTYGPKAFSHGLPGFAVAVKRSYGKKPKEGEKVHTLWQGVITVFFKEAPFLDLEVQLVAGTKGPFVQFPQRFYSSRAKKTVWIKQVVFRDRQMAALCAEAIRVSMEVEKAREKAEERIVARWDQTAG